MICITGFWRWVISTEIHCSEVWCSTRHKRSIIEKIPPTSNRLFLGLPYKDHAFFIALWFKATQVVFSLVKLQAQTLESKLIWNLVRWLFMHSYVHDVCVCRCRRPASCLRLTLFTRGMYFSSKFRLSSLFLHLGFLCCGRKILMTGFLDSRQVFIARDPHPPSLYTPVFWLRSIL